MLSAGTTPPSRNSFSRTLPPGGISTITKCDEGEKVAYNGKVVYKKGVLHKESKSFMKSRWRPRWVVLTDGFLFYWAFEKDFWDGRPHKNAVDLRDCSLATAEQHTKKHTTFGIFHTKRHDYFFDALEEKEMVEWVQQIEKSTVHSRTRRGGGGLNNRLQSEQSAEDSREFTTIAAATLAAAGASVTAQAQQAALATSEIVLDEFGYTEHSDEHHLAEATKAVPQHGQTWQVGDLDMSFELKQDGLAVTCNSNGISLHFNFALFHRRPLCGSCRVLSFIAAGLGQAQNRFNYLRKVIHWIQEWNGDTWLLKDHKLAAQKAGGASFQLLG